MFIRKIKIYCNGYFPALNSPIILVYLILKILVLLLQKNFNTGSPSLYNKDHLPKSIFVLVKLKVRVVVINK